jgi:transposase
MSGWPRSTWPRTRAWCARRNAIRVLGAQLRKDGIEIVTLESTSDYWRIWFFVLEACGLAVQLVQASQAKNLPGRPKTDLLTELPDVAAAQEAQAFPSQSPEWPKDLDRQAMAAMSQA